MYAIYGNIYHQYTPNLSIYTIHGSYGLSYKSYESTSIGSRPSVPLQGVVNSSIQCKGLGETEPRRATTCKVARSVSIKMCCPRWKNMFSFWGFLYVLVCYCSRIQSKVQNHRFRSSNLITSFPAASNWWLKNLAAASMFETHSLWKTRCKIEMYTVYSYTVSWCILYLWKSGPIDPEVSPIDGFPQGISRVATVAGGTVAPKTVQWYDWHDQHWPTPHLFDSLFQGPFTFLVANYPLSKWM